LYRPAPVAPARAPERDFDDLPGEEILVPDNANPPDMQKQNSKPDALDNLIDVFE
jgi:penicillin-binding protein 1A